MYFIKYCIKMEITNIITHSPMDTPPPHKTNTVVTSGPCPVSSRYPNKTKTQRLHAKHVGGGGALDKTPPLPVS